MNMRLHYAKEYVIKYGSVSSFCTLDMGAIYIILRDYSCQMFSDEGEVNENSRNFSVPKRDIENLVEDLKNNTDRDIYGVQIDDLIHFFSNALKETTNNGDSDINFSWF